MSLPSAKMQTDTQAATDPVVIVGGGHVGLSFALLLADLGMASMLLEQRRYPKISPSQDATRQHYLDSRNTALSRRTVHIYNQIGLWNKLQEKACRIDSVHISEQGSFGRAILNKTQEQVESFGQVIENAWLGRKLLLAVKQNPLITLIDGATVQHIEQDHKQVTLSYQRDDHSELERCQGQILVGCDGRDSTVRQLLGIDVSTYDYQQVAIVGVVQTDKPHEHVAIERFSPAGPLAVLPLTDASGDGHSIQQAGYRRSVVWICDQDEQTRYLDDTEYFLQTLQTAFGQRAGNFVEAGRRGAYPLVKVLAKQQVQGRCVIMGNAAHTLHPVAGQGFNLCLRDAHALAHLLAKQAHANKDLAEPTVLAQYAKSRQADQRRVIRFCDAVVHGFTHRHTGVKLARNVALLAFDRVPYIKPLVASYAMGLKS